MKKRDMNGKDLLLAFLYSPGIGDDVNEPIVGRTKITKMVFLFEEEIYPLFFKESLEIELPEFEAYHFGPFSKQLFEDLAFFECIGMIVKSETNIPLSGADKIEAEEAFEADYERESSSFGEEESERYEMAYSLSKNGIKYVEEQVWPLFTKSQVEKLKAFKKQISRVSLDSLLKYVYEKYPEQTKNSKIAYKYLNTEKEK